MTNHYMKKARRSEKYFNTLIQRWGKAIGSRFKTACKYYWDEESCQHFEDTCECGQGFDNESDCKDWIICSFETFVEGMAYEMDELDD